MQACKFRCSLGAFVLAKGGPKHRMVLTGLRHCHRLGQLRLPYICSTVLLLNYIGKRNSVHKVRTGIPHGSFGVWMEQEWERRYTTVPCLCSHSLPGLSSLTSEPFSSFWELTPSKYSLQKCAKKKIITHLESVMYSSIRNMNVGGNPDALFFTTVEGGFSLSTFKHTGYQELV